MSYCRFGDRYNVYAFRASEGFVTLIAGHEVRFLDRSRRRFLDRLTRLRKAGFKIDPRAFRRLRAELRGDE